MPLCAGSAKRQAGRSRGRLQDAGAEVVGRLAVAGGGLLLGVDVTAADGVRAVRPVAATAGVHLADHLRVAGRFVIAVVVVVGADVAGLLGTLALFEW